MNYSVVYMVAGLSSRFGGKIKQFAKVGPNGETLIEYSLNQAIESGFKKIIFIVSKKTENFFREKFQFSYRGIPIYYAIQNFNDLERDKPWGTADALCSEKNLFANLLLFVMATTFMEKKHLRFYSIILKKIKMGQQLDISWEMFSLKQEE